MHRMEVVVTQQQFNSLHKIDRTLYTLMVIKLWRDPLECMQIMAFFIWLERVGYLEMVAKALTLPLILVNELADEAVTCLNCIANENWSPTFEANNDISIMQSLMDKEISLKILFKNRVRAIQGISKVVDDVCKRAFSDIMQHAIQRNAAILAQSVAASQSPTSRASVNLTPSPPHPRFRNRAPGNPSVFHSRPNRDTFVAPDDRTLFVTFSKGYPVFEWEVKEFFTMAYGDCIEALHMQDVAFGVQPLYARVVFRSGSTIELIINGLVKAKFTINGKHVWARKFVPKRQGKSLLKSLGSSASSSSSQPSTS